MFVVIVTLNVVLIHVLGCTRFAAIRLTRVIGIIVVLLAHRLAEWRNLLRNRVE